ncbi:Protein CBG03866, partial [Caenorhabditis briggsae]
VNAGENLKKLMEKEFVRPTKHLVLLPYFEELESAADKNLQFILNGMTAAFLTENSVEATEYTDMFVKHLRQFGLRMPKETFLKLIRFFYEALLRKDQNRDLMITACYGFGKMMKLTRCGSFGYRDLVLDWKPVYDLYIRALNGKIKPDISTHLNEAIVPFSLFYHPESHGEIFETLLQEITIGSHIYMEQFMQNCRIFLTVEGMNEEDAKKYTVGKWIKEIWDLYLKADMNTSWTSIAVEFMSELCYFHPGAYDLSPHYNVLFTKMMRSFELTVRGGKVAVGDGQEVFSNTHLASICVYTIGGPNSSLSYFQRLMKYILFNVHPLNAGEHTEQIGSFLTDFISQFKGRLKDERLRYKKRQCSKEYYLNDSDVDAVTTSIMDVVVMLMFSSSFQDNYKLVHNLTTVNRELVAPKLLDHLYSSLTAVSEPHRLSVIIETISAIIFEVIRQPDSNYRTPQDITFDSTWLKLLEEERKNWPSYKTGSEVPEIKSHQFKSLRAHAFYIMEVFVNHINVSDVDRTAFIFKTLIVLFSSFPLMDFSASIEFHGKEMTEDDKILCLLSKRIPHLVEFTLNKILDVITCLSVVAPKCSGQSAGASISNESQKQVGEEEAVLKSGISQLVKVLFERVDEKLRKTLFERLFSYITTVEFSNNLATELLSSLVMSAVWISRDAFRHYGEFISKKLKELITDDIQKTRTPPSSVLFYVELARPLFAATHQMILENESLLFGILEMFLSCQDSTIHKCATFGVTTFLSVLLYIETEATASPENDVFAKPLQEWNPIKYWAKCSEYKDTNIRWYIPAKPEIECAERISNKFFFPYIAKLKEMDHDRDTFRRIINHLMTVMQDLKVLQHPESLRPITDIYTPFCLPIPSSSLGVSCSLEYELKGPNGENIREEIVSMIEKISKKIQDPVSLTNLSILAFKCLGKKRASTMDSSVESFLTDAHVVMVDSTYGNAVKSSQHTMDTIAFVKHQRAMSLILELGWLKDENSTIRLDVWDAVLRIKVFDELKICVLFEEICKEILALNKLSVYWRGSRETHEERNKKVAAIAIGLMTNSDFWKQFLDDDSLKKQTDVWFNYQITKETSKKELVEMLFKKHIKNQNHHHTRENLARTMVYQTQKEGCDERTIALLLSQLNDEQYYCRKEAREWLTHWMYETKPKSVRIDLPTPKRIDHGVSMESGIREDNLWLVYDSENLPNTEQKWNEMIFVERGKGSCRWEKTISVVRKRKDGLPLEFKQLTSSDCLAIDSFSNSDFVSNLIKSRLIEKEDHTLPNRHFFRLFKYIIRNYPEEIKPLDLILLNFKELLKSKQRSEQLLAAELFIGIVHGLKHRSFSQLVSFWNDIKISLDQFFNIMVLDAEPSWSCAHAFILNGDLRRHWWFLESLITGAKKTNRLTEFQQAFRLSSLIFKGWYHGEIMKRVSGIAWNKLQTAVTDSLRYAVGSVFRSTAQICEKNTTATLINIPSRFVPDSLDTTIQKIIEKIPHLKLTEDPETARNCQSDSALGSPRSRKLQPRRRRRSISEDLRDRMSLIYFRTLLETIIQYYESSTQSWSPFLVQILPKLMEYANEDDYEVSEETYRDVDITQNSAVIIHDYMSASWLRNEFVDSIVNSWVQTFLTHSESSRVRLAVIKFVQASVYSNMYPMCLKARREKVENLLFKAVFDPEISVRKEAAKCLLLFIHCEYIHVSEEKIEELSRILQSKTDLEANTHGAALALGALVLSYPFSLPSKILKPLRILSTTCSKRTIIQQSMTETLREFRRQHRDDWVKSKEILGESLVFDIENATAPAYYA